MEHKELLCLMAAILWDVAPDPVGEAMGIEREVDDMLILEAEHGRDKILSGKLADVIQKKRDERS